VPDTELVMKDKRLHASEFVFPVRMQLDNKAYKAEEKELGAS